MTVHCVAHHGPSQSSVMLANSEDVFRLVDIQGVYLLAQFIAGDQDDWADALSRQNSLATESSLSQEAFQDMVDLFSQPQIDLFASLHNHRLTLFLSRSSLMPAGGKSHRFLLSRSTQGACVRKNRLAKISITVNN